MTADNGWPEESYPYTVIVVGSGCSCGLGVPTLADFMDSVLEKAKGDDLGHIQKFIREIRASSAYVRNRLLNIEEVYGLADMQSEELGEVKEDRESATKVKRALNRTIYRIAECAGREFLVDKTRERYPVRDLEEIKRESKAQWPLHQEYGTCYSTLLAYLCLVDYADMAGEKRRFPLFVQFNWDLALDRALYYWWDAEQKKRRDGGLPEAKELPWYPRLETSGEASYRLGRYSELPQVARPHGAINWLEKKGKRTGLISTAFPPSRPWIDPHPVMSLAKGGRIGAKADNMAIVPPTWRKEAGKTGLAHQWSVMEHGLEKARQIAFIGYSLPRSDLYFRHFLALALRRNNHLPRVYVWNPSILNPVSDEHQSYVDLFEPLAREKRLFGIPGRFGDPALFDLARAMREATPLAVP